MTRPLLHSQEGAVSPCAPGLKHCLNTSSLRRPASGFATNALECNDLSVRWQGDAAPPALTGGCRFNLRTCSKTLSQHLQPRHECLGVLALVSAEGLGGARAVNRTRASTCAGSRRKPCWLFSVFDDLFILENLESSACASRFESQSQSSS